MTRRKKDIHEERMKMKIDDFEELTVEHFNDALKKILSKYSSNYKFILKGGESLMNAVFALFFILWKEEKVPVKWLNSELV